MKKSYSKSSRQGLPGGPNEMFQKVKGIIVSERGQWDFPGMTTLVPTDDGSITMQDVPYPVLGQDETGYTQMMYPEQEYQFPGRYVLELPMAQKGCTSGSCGTPPDPCSGWEPGNVASIKGISYKGMPKSAAQALASSSGCSNIMTWWAQANPPATTSTVSPSSSGVTTPPKKLIKKILVTKTPVVEETEQFEKIEEPTITQQLIGPGKPRHTYQFPFRNPVSGDTETRISLVTPEHEYIMTKDQFGELEPTDSIPSIGNFLYRMNRKPVYNLKKYGGALPKFQNTGEKLPEQQVEEPKPFVLPKGKGYFFSETGETNLPKKLDRIEKRRLSRNDFQTEEDYVNFLTNKKSKFKDFDCTEDGCAEFANNRAGELVGLGGADYATWLRGAKYTIGAGGHAWQTYGNLLSLGGKSIFNNYRKQGDISQAKPGDIVGLRGNWSVYSSPRYDTSGENAPKAGVDNSHQGVVEYVDSKGNVYVRHNVNGTARVEKIEPTEKGYELDRSGWDIVTVARPNFEKYKYAPIKYRDEIKQYYVDPYISDYNPNKAVVFKGDYVIGANPMRVKSDFGNFMLGEQRQKINQLTGKSNVEVFPVTEKSGNEDMQKFIDSLNDNKEALMDYYRLSDDEFNEIAKYAIATAGAESDFGTSSKLAFKTKVPDIARGAKIIRDLKNYSSEEMSSGIGQVKPYSLDEVFKQTFGLHRGNIVLPEKNALAVFSHLVDDTRKAKLWAEKNKDLPEEVRTNYPFLGTAVYVNPYSVRSGNLTYDESFQNNPNKPFEPIGLDNHRLRIISDYLKDVDVLDLSKLYKGQPLEEIKITPQQKYGGVLSIAQNGLSTPIINLPEYTFIDEKIPENIRLANTAKRLVEELYDVSRPAVGFTEKISDLFIPGEKKYYENTCVKGVCDIFKEANLNSGIPEDVLNNKDFLENYSKYGFTLVPNEQLQVGDIIQYYEKDRPTHLGIYVGDDEYVGDGSKDKPLVKSNIHKYPDGKDKLPFRAFRKNFKSGGSLPKAQPGLQTENPNEVKYGTPEYEQAYNQGTLTTSLSGDPEDFVRARTLPEFKITPQYTSLRDDLSRATVLGVKGAAELTGIPGTVRFAQNPVTSLKGAGNTLVDLGMTVGAFARMNPAGGFQYATQGVNPLTGEGSFRSEDVEGAFNTLDAAGLATIAGAALKAPVQQGVKQGVKQLAKSPVVDYAKEFGHSIKKGKLPTYESIYRWQPDVFPERLVEAGKTLTPLQQTLTGSWYTKYPGQLAFYMRSRPGAGNVNRIRLSDRQIANLESSMPDYAKGMSGKSGVNRVPTSNTFMPGELIVPESIRSKSVPMRFQINPIDYSPQSVADEIAKQRSKLKNLLNNPYFFPDDIDRTIRNEVIEEHAKNIYIPMLKAQEQPILGIPRKYFPYQGGGSLPRAQNGDELFPGEGQYYNIPEYTFEYRRRFDDLPTPRYTGPLMNQRLIDEATQREYEQRRRAIEKSVAAAREPLSTQRLARESAVTGDKFSLQMNLGDPYNNPRLYETLGALDFINPSVMLGDMVTGLGSVPYNVQEGNYGAALLGLGLPLATGALASIGVKSPRQFINNLVNPVAGIGDTPKQLPGSSNVAPVVNTTPAPWTMQEMPGLHIKSTMSGSPLEKQLSKTGEINRNNIIAHINKAETSAADKFTLQRVLDEKFPNQNKIDYNQFRKAVSDEAIELERKVVENYVHNNWGVGRLGYPDAKRSSYDAAIKSGQDHIEYLETKLSGTIEPTSWETSDQIRKNIELELSETKAQLAKNLSEYEKLPLENVSVTYGNPTKFGRGNAKHFDESTLGHARTLVSSEEPDIMHFLEQQSDYWQNLGKTKSIDIERYKKILAKKEAEYLNSLETLKKLKETKMDAAGYPIQDYQIKQFEDIVNQKGAELNMRKGDIFNPQQKEFLGKAHQERLMQENVRYAAEQGKSSVRFPTSETAAKIQGYSKVEAPNQDIINKQIDDAWYKYTQATNQKEKTELWNIYENTYSSKFAYSPEHQTILKKYSEQPKTIKKLFGVEPRIVTDSKGNTWYEFDIPESYKQGKAEIKAFSMGGNLNFQKGGIKNLNPYGELQVYPVESGVGLSGEAGLDYQLPFGNSAYLSNTFNVEPGYASYFNPGFGIEQPLGNNRGSFFMGAEMFDGRPRINAGLKYRFEGGGSLPTAGDPVLNFITQQQPRRFSKSKK